MSKSSFLPSFMVFELHVVVIADGGLEETSYGLV